MPWETRGFTSSANRCRAPFSGKSPDSPLLTEPREQVSEPEPPQGFVRVPPPYRTVGDMSRGRTYPGRATDASPSRRLEAGPPAHRPIARSPNETAAVQRPGEKSARHGLGGT